MSHAQLDSSTWDMWWIVNLVNMDLIWSYPRRQDHKNPLNFLDKNNWTCVLFPREVHLSPPPIISSAKCNILVVNPTWFRIKGETRADESKRYDWCTSRSNILKFLFWNKRKRNLTLGYFKTIGLDDPHYNCPLSRLPWALHGPASQTYVLGRLFEVWHYLQYLFCIWHGEDPDGSPFWLVRVRVKGLG